MCRNLLYLGPPVTLEALLLAPEHSLLRQSWTPRLQTYGVVNADGFGAGWYDRARRAEPARYRRAQPMWTDRSFASIAGTIASDAVLASVRSATPGFPVEESGVAPFVSGTWLFAHNGVIDEFKGEPSARLRRALSDRRLSTLEGTTDSELLFAMTLDRLDAGATPGEALAGTVAAVKEIAGGRLNLLLTDGARAAATRYGDTLFALRGGSFGNEAVVVASEPFDEDPAWKEVPDLSLVEIEQGHVTVTSL
jgi:glutamine amidotransferase